MTGTQIAVMWDRELTLECHYMTPDLPDHVSINRESWTRANAEHTDARARDAWVQEEIR